MSRARTDEDHSEGAGGVLGNVVQCVADEEAASEYLAFISWPRSHVP